VHTTVGRVFAHDDTCTKTVPLQGVILGEVDFLAGAKSKVEAMVARARGGESQEAVRQESFIATPTELFRFRGENERSTKLEAAKRLDRFVFQLLRRLPVVSPRV
jgi:hypothetical protein